MANHKEWRRTAPPITINTEREFESDRYQTDGLGCHGRFRGVLHFDYRLAMEIRMRYEDHDVRD